MQWSFKIMDTKFTKAPWIVTEIADTAYIDHEGTEFAIARMFENGLTANAHLIAASPDMYELLEGILSEHLESDVKNEIEEVLKSARGE